jgi:hypothetical protein
MKELLSSLAKVKKEVGSLSKTATNPFFKSKYFDINSLIEQVDPLLEKNGLILLQPIKENKVLSIIYHVETGQNIHSEMILPNLQDPQKLGSAITYYRRYTLQSLLGLQAEDDDGNKAAKPVVVKKVIPVLTDETIDSVIAKGADTIKSCLESIKNGTRIATQVQILKLENGSK